VVVPCNDQGVIEDVHMMMAHAMTVALQQAAPVEDEEPGEAARDLAL
jgi:hypothetical protein